MDPRPVYEVHHAALVQPPTPPLWSGKLNKAGLTLGTSTAVWEKKPQRDPASPSGMYVSRAQLDWMPYLRLGRYAALWVPLSYGLNDGAFVAAPGLLQKPERGVFTGGFGAAWAGTLVSGWYMGGMLETSASMIPSRIYATCVRNCEYATERTKEKQETESIFVLRLTWLTGWDFGRWRIYGGLTVRNHPSNVKVTQERLGHFETLVESMDSEVTTGPFYLIPGFGIEGDPWKFFSIRGQVFLPLPEGEPVLHYGAILGVALDFHFPEDFFGPRRINPDAPYPDTAADTISTSRPHDEDDY